MAMALGAHTEMAIWRTFCAWHGLSHLTAEGADWASLQPPHLESLILNFPGNIKVQCTSFSENLHLTSSFYRMLLLHVTLFKLFLLN